jgi:hypothetical protein
MRHAAWSQRGRYALFNALLVGTFLLHYGMAHDQVDTAEAVRTAEFLRNYWKDAFPPDGVVNWPLWLFKVFTGNMLAYPIGANHGGSTLTLVFVLVGSVSLWRAGRHSLLALCWLPFGLNLIAAILNKYPFGDSARITLHLAPFICILAAQGLMQALDWIRSPVSRSRLHLTIYVLLGCCGVAGIVRDVWMPFKTEHDRDVRQLARDIGKQLAPGEPVVLCHSRDEDLLAEFLWYLRADGLPLQWQSAGIDGQVQSYWQVQCSNDPLGEPTPIAGWRITSSEMRWVPSENKWIPPMNCRWTRLARD